ncbi:MAG: type III pantothenate kinase [Bacteroidia bacterium]
MNLCIDIGNTSTKASLFKDGKELRYMKPFTLADLSEIRENANVRILVSRSGRDEEIESKLKTMDFLSHLTSIPIDIDYKTPETLGRDRIATGVGAYMLDEDATWLIIDLGTCLTMDLVEDGVFRGGLISPGVDMRLRAMNHFTAGLPYVDMDYDQKFPGKSTKESLQVGVCQSIGYEINGYIRQLNSQYDNLKIVDCSSQNIFFDKEVKNEIFARPKLVVEGLNHILEYNVKK